MRGDLTVIGPQASMQRRIGSGGTAIEAGEPIHSTSTLTAGVASANVFVLAAADTPVIGTHRFGGVAIKKSLNAAAGTTNAQRLPAACPVPYVGRIRGRAETVASVDTSSELIGFTGDVVLIDYNATGASDSGELYTIKETASADTSGLEIVDGNVATGHLEVIVDARAYRHDVS